MKRFAKTALHAGWLAGLVFAVALLVFGAATPGYLHAQHAVGLLGVRGMAWAGAWNALGFVLPGLLVMVFAYALAEVMRRDAIGFAGRIGLWLLLISGLALAGNGVFAYDPQRPDERAAQLHVAMLTISLLAFLPGVLLIAASSMRQRPWRALGVVGPVVAVAVIANVTQVTGELFPELRSNPGYPPRLTYVLYFGWFALAAWIALRRPRAGRDGVD